MFKTQIVSFSTDVNAHVFLCSCLLEDKISSLYTGVNMVASLLHARNFLQQQDTRLSKAH